ncbi:MAG: alpha/beta hydrolase [Roseococcus sp.]|jgi:acetyl esterase
MPAPLHPDCQRLLDMARAANTPGFETLTPAAARAQYAAGRAALQAPPPPVASSCEVRLPSGRGARLLRPMGSAPGEALACLVFAHGGGWVFGDLDTHDHLARSLANGAGCSVLSVDYRLAPEHRFPAAVEDLAEAVRFAAAEAGRLGLDAARLAVGGDSAGGNLAAVMALMARDGALPPLRFQLLLYPVVEMAQTHDSMARFEQGAALTTPAMRWFRAHYAPDPASWNDWRASPLRAASLAGVAPAFVLTVGHDPLVGEGREYANRLEREGVPVTHLHAADMMHGVLTMSGFIPRAGLLIEVAARALREGLV